jgi:hypothetical protein
LLTMKHTLEPYTEDVAYSQGSRWSCRRRLEPCPAPGALPT